jgi:tetratricopeptide (TPR) repeat protein
MARSRYNRGNIHLRQRQLLERHERPSTHALDAVRCFRQATALRPWEPDFWNNLGNAIRSVAEEKQAAAQAEAGTEKEGEEGKEEEALRCYERAAELKRGFVGAHFNRATLLASLGRSDEALVAYDTVLGLDPAYPHARSARGHVHLGSGELARAERDYRLAVELQPSSASELNNRCHVLHRLSRWSEAVAACRRAVGIDAGHSWAWYNLGKALEGGGGGGDDDDDDDAALGEARASYERALSLQPQWLVMREALESARRKGGGGGRDSSHGMDASSSAPALDHEERVATSLVSSVDPNQLTNLAGSYE